MLTKNFTRGKDWKISRVNDAPPPQHLASLRVPPAWVNVLVDPDPLATVVATGTDVAGRRQKLYSKAHTATAKAGKFERIAALLEEWDSIYVQIMGDVTDPCAPFSIREAARIALLIYETGMRPGSNAETLAKVQAYGATTLQLRHVKPCQAPDRIRLKFIGKKGVAQNVLVTNPELVPLFILRKAETTAYSVPLFRVGLSAVRDYFKSLGSGIYTPKDFRTARGTSLAIKLLGNRKRLPKSPAKRKKIVNKALDRVAKQLGNTRAISRSSYVDPSILERFLL